jgi:UDP-N-acetylmuramoyl-tripeptide--D-alanyl-D-alanine ligase
MSTSALWTAADFIAGTGGRPVGGFGDVGGISIDTRTIGKGDAFFAIQGEARDGHDFVSAALANGATVAVVSQNRIAAMPPGAPLVVVPDVLAALVALGQAGRARVDAKIIGVTGSVGKTGTKEALRLVLEREGATHASVASYNNHWGVPLTLARMPEETRFGVFEMGMNHAGEIAPLTRMVRPDVAVITTIAPVHLENLGSIEAIADAKAEIFEGLGAGGTAVVNRDVPQFARIADHARGLGVGRIVSFGEAAGADARLINCSLKADCSFVSATILGDPITYKIGAPGRHVVMNSLGVLAAVKLAGADLAIAGLMLGRLSPPAGRGQRHALHVGGGTATLIDESYNANPTSMRAALALLAQTPVGPGGRRIAVMGDMLELGPEEFALHAQLAPALIEGGIDLVYSAGPRMAHLDAALPGSLRGAHRPTSAELHSLLIAAIRAGDVVMIKGSLGSRMGPVVKALLGAFGEPPAPRAAQG